MQKQRCYESLGRSEILVEGPDANASLGVRDRHDNYEAIGRDRVMGQYGIPHVNAAGRALLHMLGMHELCVPTSYFQKTSRGTCVESSHTTWRHPGRKSPFQLDYFIMRQADLKRVRDAGVWKQGVDSDHKAIFLKLELAQKFNGPREPRKQCVDRRLLEDPSVRSTWRAAVSRNVEVLRGSINRDGEPATALQVLEGAMVLAAKEVLAL